MAETLLGLVFLSTTFMLSHLMGDIDRYLDYAQLLQARYLYSDPKKQGISAATIATDYQKFRTIRTNIGAIMILQNALFTIGILCLWTWGWYLTIQVPAVGVDYNLWAWIVWGLMLFVIIFQFTEFTVGSGHEGIIKILTTLAIQPVTGESIIFREYARQIICDNGLIPREALDRKLSMNFVAKFFFWLSRHAANELSCSIILGQFVIMYLITNFIPSLHIFNLMIFWLLLLVAIIFWVLYIYQTRKNSRHLAKLHIRKS